MNANPIDKSASSLLSGLTAAEATQRLSTEGFNLLPDNKPKSTTRIIIGVVTEPMFLMLIVAGAIYLALGDKAEALFLLVSVLAVISITLSQEHKAQRALESLRNLSAQRAVVIRDGKEIQIAASDLVRDDIMSVREGDRIAADAILMKGLLTVNESLLTGEAVPVDKIAAQNLQSLDSLVLAAPGGESPSKLFAGTVATSGAGLAKVCATGSFTAVGRIGTSLINTIEPTSNLQQSSRRIVRLLAIAAVFLALSLFGMELLWNKHNFLESLLSGIALAMAILPEEIPVIFTVFLAMGAWRIARINVLTRRMSAVESLGAITVLAVDKTGTLTQNRMSVVELAKPEFMTNQNLENFQSDQAQELPEDFHLLAEFAMLASPENPFDPMEIAINEFNHRWLTGTDRVRGGRIPVYEYPLSTEILAVTKAYTTNEIVSPSSVAPLSKSYLLATKGAPEAIADLCHLALEQRESLRHQVESMASRGLRVLGVAYAHWSAQEEGDHPWPGHHDFDFRLVGLLGLADPPREDVAAALAECRQAGVRVIMMTGDHPATALAIARQVGLSEHTEVITGAEISSLNDKDLLDRLSRSDICARLKPAHKHRLVEILQKEGEVVAMTGDGVNDAPALKAADIGIAMGQRGTDVAREAAALVLLDNSFASIVAALRQGRKIYDNISKATRFIFAVHVPVIVLILMPSLFHWPMLLLPVHIVLLELLIDPACSILFEAEPAASDIMRRRPRPPDATPFSPAHISIGVVQGLGIAFILLACYAWLHGHHWDTAQCRSLIFVSLLFCILFLVFTNRNTSKSALAAIALSNPWLTRMAIGMGLFFAAIMSMPWAQHILKIQSLNMEGSLILVAILLASYCWLEIIRRSAFVLVD